MSSNFIKVDFNYILDNKDAQYYIKKNKTYNEITIHSYSETKIEVSYQYTDPMEVGEQTAKEFYYSKNTGDNFPFYIKTSNGGKKSRYRRKFKSVKNKKKQTRRQSKSVK